MRALINLYFKHRVLVSITLVLSIVSGFATTSVIALVSEAVSNGLEDASIYEFLLAVFITVAGALSSQIISHRLSSIVSYELQINMIRRVMATPYHKIEKMGAHRVMATLTHDVGALSEVFQVIPEFVLQLTFILSCLAYLAYLDINYFMALIIFLGAGLTLAGLMMLFSERYFQDQREEEDHLIGFFNSIIHGAKQLRLNTRRGLFQQRLTSNSAAKLRDLNFKAQTILVFASQWNGLIFYIILGGIVFGVSAYFPGDKEVVSTYAMAIIFLFGPVSVVVDSANEIIGGKVALEKLNSLQLSKIDSWEDINKVEATKHELNAKDDINFKGVHFSYERNEDGVFELGPIDLCIRSGKIHFIVGGNGSGKSTLAKIMVGLYRPSKGTISVGGTIVNDQNNEWFRNHFSAVFPDFYLFQNILDGDELDVDKKVERYLDLLQLDKIVSNENGVFSKTDLSQGQSKRLALLITYLEDRPVYVFDEWAADQDPVFKDKFYREILPELKREGKTIVVISHDDRYFDAADILLKVDQGVVRELGENEQAFEKIAVNA